MVSDAGNARLGRCPGVQRMAGNERPPLGRMSDVRRTTGREIPLACGMFFGQYARDARHRASVNKIRSLELSGVRGSQPFWAA